MKLSESLALAIQNIRGAKGRSFLTMLGIIIGISAVMVIIGIGNGMQGYMTASFQSLGTNTITVSLTGVGTSKKLSIDDMRTIVEENGEYFSDLSPSVSMNGSIKIGTETMEHTSAQGVGDNYFAIRGYKLRSGRALRWMDIENRKNVCVIGAYLNNTQFAGSGVGQTIRLGGNLFTIVGVLDQIDKEMSESGSDNVVYLPYSTAARLSGSGTVNSYTVLLTDEEQATAAVKAMENELYSRLGSDKAYMVISLTSILSMMTEMVSVVITVLSVIAGISLVVGGVGIMNIMLVSVSERTREIGIRKALGAKERYILMQFVMEAAVLSALGGTIGIAFGFALSAVATVLIGVMLNVELTVAPSLYSIALAFGASAAIGVLFGYLPARKAAVLNPIDALRYE